MKLKVIMTLALAGAFALAPAYAQEKKSEKKTHTNELGQTYDPSTKIGNGVKSDKHAGTNFSDEAAKKGVNVGGRAHSTVDQQHGPKTWFTQKADKPVTGSTGEGAAADAAASTTTVTTTTVSDPWAEIRELMNKQEYDKVAPLLEEKAAAGDANAAYNLGVLYYNGQGVTRDMAQAAKWFAVAGNGGNGAAAFNAANIYENGIGGVTKDATKAIELYRIAAKANMPGAADALKRLGAE